MNTYESNINDRIENAKMMVYTYNELRKSRSELDYSTEYELIWEAMEREKQILGNIKRSVRSLAKALGFTIKEQEFMDSISTWEGILRCIEHRWNVSQQMLHSPDCYTMMYFEN